MATVTSLGFNIFSRYDGSGMRQARADIDDTTNSTTASTNSLNSWSGRIALATKAAMLFGPALSPIAANMTAVGGAAVVMGTSVGLALAGYGLGMKNAVHDAENLRDGHAKLTAEQQRATDVLNELQYTYQTFGKSFATESLKAYSAALEGANRILQAMEPIAAAVAPEITRLAEAFNKWTQSPALKQYADLIKASVVPILHNLIDAGRLVTNVLGDAFRAFTPEAVKLSEALKQGAQSMKAWSDEGGFQKFLKYAHENGPEVKEFFIALKDAMKNIADIMRELGPLSLSITTNLLKLVAALPPELIDAIVKGFIAWRLAMAAWAVATTIATAAHIAFMIAASPMLVLMAGAALTIGLVIAAVAALAVGIYFLVTRWEGFSHAMGTAWSATWNFIKGVANAVWQWMQKSWDDITKKFIQIWQQVSGSLVSSWNQVWQWMKTAVTSVWNALKTAWNAVCSAFTTAWNAVSGALRTAWNAVWNFLKTTASTVWNGIKTGWNSFINGLKNTWTTVSGALKTAWTAVWNFLRTNAQTVWNGIKTAWQAFLNFFKSIWTTVSNALKTAWTAVWNFLRTNAQTVWNTIKTAWQTFLNFFKSIWTTVSNALKTAWTAVWNFLKTNAQGIWNTIKAAWQTFLNFFKSIWDTVSGALKTAWETVWNWLKDTAQTVWDAVKTAWTTFTDGIKEIWDTASEILKTAWEAVWNWLRDTASSIWDGITNVIETAVNFIIDIINGLIGAWNAVAGVVGLPTIGTLGHVGGGGGGGGGTAMSGSVSSAGTGAGGVPGLGGGTGIFGAGGGGAGSTGVLANAEGGIIPGYSPGVDSVLSWMSPGEGVLVPEAVRGLGPDFVLGANHYFSGGRAGSGMAGGFNAGGMIPGFALGGILPAEIPVPGGGTVGQTPGPGVNAPNGSVIGGLGDVAAGTAGILTGGLVGSGDSPIGQQMAAGAFGLPTAASVRAMFMEWINKANGMTGALKGMGSKAAGLGMQMLQKVLAALAAKIAEMAAKLVGAGGGGGKAGNGAALPQSVKDMAAKALAAAGIPSSQLGAFLNLIAAESGGNPNAINNWDSNAAKGTPSIGLAQVIQPTFDAYSSGGSIWDPQSNLNASANYIADRYGGVVPGSPYATGTRSATQGWHLVGENGPEMRYFEGGEKVETNQALREAVGNRGGGRGGHGADCVHIEMPIHVAGNLDRDAVRKLDSEVLPKLRMCLAKGTGSNSL